MRDQVIQQRRVGRFVNLALEDLASAGNSESDNLMTELLAGAVGLLLDFRLGDSQLTIAFGAGIQL